MPCRRGRALAGDLTDIPSVSVSKLLVSSPSVHHALQTVRFPGRGDIVPDTEIEGLNWMTEAAHTPESMPVQAAWAQSVFGTDP